jgi:formylglycine-generating enzyme required for sulfatase activity
MGSTDDEYGQAQSTTPVHTVTLQGFQIGAFEVTQAQFEAVMGNNPSYTEGTYTQNNPVGNVTWLEAREFCTQLSAQTGRTFTLPSEAQWEYACRAGSTTLYSFGDLDSELGDYAWFDGNSEGQSQQVGSKLPNAWGLYDMHGSVFEHCLDSWHNDYTGAPTDGSAWEPDTTYWRVIRGGSWTDSPWYNRSANRMASPELDFRAAGLGLRVVAAPAE